MNNILIVEDESSIAENLILVCDKENWKNFRVSTILEATKKFNEDVFNFIILDVGLPDGSGFDFCREIRKKSNIPVLFLTARDDEVDKVVGLEIGADDYMTKPFSPREVIARVKAILRRSQVYSKDLSTPSKEFEIDSLKRTITFMGKILELSRYEFGILELLAKRPGQVFSRTQIMQQVWEEPDMSLERTVDAHVKSIQAKLKDIIETEYLITHRGVGYSLKDDK